MLPTSPLARARKHKPRGATPGSSGVSNYKCLFSALSTPPPSQTPLFAYAGYRVHQSCRALGEK